MIDPTVTRRGDGGWDFSWPAGTPPYQVWLDGFLIASPATAAYTSMLPGYEDAPPDLEVLDAGDVAGNDLFPPYLQLQWRGLLTAASYLVEHYTGVSGAPWESVATVTETGRGYYSWRSPPLEDETTEQYRVSALDLAGNAGTPLTFTATLCRHPLHPSVAVELSGTDVVVSGA